MKENSEELTINETTEVKKEEIPTPVTAANITTGDYAAIIQNNDKSCLDQDFSQTSQMLET